MPQPSELQKLAQLKSQVKQVSGGQPVRYYPSSDINDPSIPRTVRDALLQYGNNIYDVRANYGPTFVYAGVKSGSCTVTTTEAATGISTQFTRQGKWVVSANVALDIVSDANQLFTLSLYVVDNRLPIVGQAKLSGDGIVMVSQNWLWTSTDGNEIIKLYIAKAGGAGTSSIDLSNSTLTATWQGT